MLQIGAFLLGMALSRIFITHAGELSQPVDQADFAVTMGVVGLVMLVYGIILERRKS